MPEYRAYLIGLEGHFIRFVSLECVDDEDAGELAKKLVVDHDVSFGRGTGW